MKKALTIILTLIITTTLANALELGQPAPDLQLPNTENILKKLSDYKGKSVVVAFFPGAFIQVCTEEFCNFRDMTSELNNLNATVVGVSVDRPASNKAWAKANKLNFDILSDYNHEVVGQWDVEVKGLWDIPDLITANKAVFIVDKEGVIQYKWVAKDTNHDAPNYEEIKEALAKLQ